MSTANTPLTNLQFACCGSARHQHRQYIERHNPRPLRRTCRTSHVVNRTASGNGRGVYVGCNSQHRIVACRLLQAWPGLLGPAAGCAARGQQATRSLLLSSVDRPKSIEQICLLQIKTQQQRKSAVNVNVETFGEIRKNCPILRFVNGTASVVRRQNVVCGFASGCDEVRRCVAGSCSHSMARLLPRTGCGPRWRRLIGLAAALLALMCSHVGLIGT